MDNGRSEWVALLRDCEEAGLPEPKFRPARNNITWVCSVGEFNARSPRPIDAFNSCIDFVDGYKTGVANAKN